MAERREVRRIEYVVPDGAPWSALRRALEQALAEFRESHDLEPNAPVAGDHVHIRVAGGEVAVWFDAVDVADPASDPPIDSVEA